MIRDKVLSALLMTSCFLGASSCGDFGSQSETLGAPSGSEARSTRLSEHLDATGVISGWCESQDVRIIGARSLVQAWWSIANEHIGTGYFYSPNRSPSEEVAVAEGATSFSEIGDPSKYTYGDVTGAVGLDAIVIYHHKQSGEFVGLKVRRIYPASPQDACRDLQYVFDGDWKSLSF